MTESLYSGERFTDEESAFLRHVRFGELPVRPAPEDLVAETESETDPRPDTPPTVNPAIQG
ncbi:hypothetical protein [Catellatospora sichuanensis]|uniref:hypothetical protein n=1 Tax=Catellatospora sichuanensis TaxID=1969805 RepID=UPI0011827F49|nr:hypothetical protein [Catellatospora sichuanensis]